MSDAAATRGATSWRRGEPGLPVSSVPFSKPSARHLSLLRIWLIFHATILLGYSLLGRGFAYIGIGHVYIGEVCLGLGMIWLAGFRQWPTLLRSAPVLAIFAMQIWGAVCTIPYLQQYGFDALRDAMLWGYSWYAILVAAATLSAPRILELFLRRYRSFTRVFLLSAPALWVAYYLFSSRIPQWPVSGVPLIDVKTGDMLVHLAGVFSFFAAGLGGPFGLINVVLLVSSVGMAGSISRGGFVAFIASASLASVMGISKRIPVACLLVAVTTAAVMFATDFQIRSELSENRPVSPRELLVNLISAVTARGNAGNQQDTKEWRLAWWEDIYNYTVQGPYFLTGKGYGINLADSDGYQTESDDSLRSPHNSHLTFLARSGVPGFVIWIGLLSLWFAKMGVSYWRARRLHLESWAGIFLFVVCYVLAAVVNASFDPALEGPMLGIWFWSVVGLGIGASQVFPLRLSSKRALN